LHCDHFESANVKFGAKACHQGTKIKSRSELNNVATPNFGPKDLIQGVFIAGAHQGAIGRYHEIGHGNMVARDIHLGS
jgi:hypothetical protein